MAENNGTIIKIVVSLAVAVIIWIAGVLIGQEQTIFMFDQDNAIKSAMFPSREVKVSLMLDFGDGRVEVYPNVTVKYGSSILQLLKSVDDLTPNRLTIAFFQNEETKEVSVAGIDDYLSVSDNKKWLVWLNNASQPNELNKILLKSKDVVELKYVKLITAAESTR